jgi:hypothetical protein
MIWNILSSQAPLHDQQWFPCLSLPYSSPNLEAVESYYWWREARQWDYFAVSIKKKKTKIIISSLLYIFLPYNFKSIHSLTARIFFKQPCSQVLMVCLATSSSIMYSNSSRASSSSNWRAFLMSTERYDNMLKNSVHFIYYIYNRDLYIIDLYIIRIIKR